MSASVDKIIAQVTFEISQIDQLLASYADLLTRSQQRRPDLVEITAIASVLHSFYNGIENMFLLIAKGIDQHVPTGSQWHRDLLIQMSQPTERRNGIIPPELAQKLAIYLGFRHFYRHAYSFFLDWDELEKLVAPLDEVWRETRVALTKPWITQIPPI